MRATPIDGPPNAGDLAPTTVFDHDAAVVRDWASSVTAATDGPAACARALFADVRDRIRYDPYRLELAPEAFTASAVLASPSNWCVPKAILLTAGARAAGIPARLGFADVRNHLSSEKLQARMGTDLFVFHGYAALFLDNRWLKASPAFNAALCERFGVPALDFDGQGDALLHAYDGAGRRHMEYVADHGTWTAVPFDEMFAAFRANYGGEHPLGDDPATDPAFQP